MDWDEPPDDGWDFDAACEAQGQEAEQVSTSFLQEPNLDLIPILRGLLFCQVHPLSFFDFNATEKWF